MKIRAEILAAVVLAVTPVPAAFARPAPAPSSTASPAASPVPSPISSPTPSPSPSDVRAASIIEEALRSQGAWDRLSILTDTIGNRAAGSAAESKAVAWAKSEFERDGVSVHLEPVKEVIWRRGHEEAWLVSPVKRRLVILGLGGTVPTPPGGIEAPVIVVASSEELQALGVAKVKGKIVLFDNPFVRTGDEMYDYGVAVKYRAGGASEAAKLGAVAVLVRSVATRSLRTPHTGGTWYGKDVPKIPAAAVTIEDALLLHRFSDRAKHPGGQQEGQTGSEPGDGEPRVRLVLEDQPLPEGDGANVVAEIRGRERPDEIVLIGAHLDSWDVGDGAIDDGAGCAEVLETMRLLAAGPPPRRTVRAVLFANEEIGGGGGKGYAEAHKAELALHVAAIESDSGGGRAIGFTMKAGDGGEAMLRALVAPILATIGSARIRAGGGGADIGHLEDAGVPQIGLEPDTSRYFDWHHTEADTIDKMEPSELQHAAATLAAAAWLLADSMEMLPRIPPAKPDAGVK